jgi:hypothetical protein
MGWKWDLNKACNEGGYTAQFHDSYQGTWHGLLFYLADGGSNCLWNIAKFLGDYMELYPTTQLPSDFILLSDSEDRCTQPRNKNICGRTNHVPSAPESLITKLWHTCTHVGVLTMNWLAWTDSCLWCHLNLRPSWHLERTKANTSIRLDIRNHMT